MSEQQTGTVTRGRGRPPRLSRAQIVQAAVDLVYADPQTPLTIKRVAGAVGSAPMALYRYFPDRDDLLHAVADQVATEMARTATAIQGTTWQEKLRTWMLFSMESLRPYPQLLTYIASTRQPAWLPSFTLLTEVLGPLGLSHEDQALAITLIGTTIVGQASLAARRPPADDLLTVMREALHSADEQDRRRVGPVLDSLPQALDRLYDTVIDTTIAAIEGLVRRPPAGRAQRATAKTPTAPIFSSSGS